VPVVVAASELHEQRSSAQVADSLAAARVLTAERRVFLRHLGDTVSEAMSSATRAQPIDESALQGRTEAEIIAECTRLA
jgi:hypothetical protein